MEREKHSLINFIVAHTNDLNASQRTKLAIMSEEELLNKALSLGISLVDINNYTKPQLHTKIRIHYYLIYVDGKTACTTD